MYKLFCSFFDDAMAYQFKTVDDEAIAQSYIERLNDKLIGYCHFWIETIGTDAELHPISEV